MTMKKHLFAILLPALFLGLSAADLRPGSGQALAQSPIDVFAPNANNGVRSIAVQADGKILVGGWFTIIGGQSRNRIARLNADGTVDAAFNPNSNNTIYSIAVQADGKILVGGEFDNIGGQARSRIARLNADGTVDAAFDPSAYGAVYSIAVQSDGKILVGGQYTSIGGQARKNIARLNADGTAEAAFNPNADGHLACVNSIAVQSDGEILVGGKFTSIGGQARNNIARLNADGTLDAAFDPNADSDVYSIAVQADGKILVGGNFTNMGGQARNRIARLNADGTLDAAFDPNSNSGLRSIAVQADGKILVGGYFTSIGGQERHYIARLNSDGTAGAAFDPNANSGLRSIAVQADGKILVGGWFTSIGGQARNRIARLNADGTADTTFNPNANNTVHSIAVQTDGKILVGGNFTNIGGQARNNIARLNADGTADAFNPDPISAGIYSIAVQADGKILVGGTFISIGGQARNRIARLNADGTADTTFNPNADDYVYSIAVQADGKILVGGLFDNIGGQARNRIARLNADGTADMTFNPNGNAYVFPIAVQADGKILVGGTFTSMGGQVRNRIARLNADGTLDAAFDPNADNDVYSIAVRSDGKILVGGAFTSIGGQARNRIARLNADGTADAFDPNANSAVYSIAVQSDGKILVGGEFTSIGGLARNRIARLSMDDAALQELTASADGTTITWMRSQSSPEIHDVTFWHSNDMSVWTYLGEGSRILGGWEKTGLSLPIDTNIYIRAMGNAKGGYCNASTSIIESARNIYLSSNPAPAVTSISPDNATAGGSGFTLTVNGADFVNNSVVRWNGSDRATTHISSAQLTAAILAEDIAAAGTATVTVFSPAPGGGTSNGATFTINDGPVIVMKTQPASPQIVPGPYLVQAVITDPAKKKIAKSLNTDSLYYRVDGAGFIGVHHTAVNGDTFDFQIPAVDTALVEYYVQAWDNLGATTLEPASGYYSFNVDTLAPAITYTSPAWGATGVGLSEPIVIAFSEPMNTGSLTSYSDPSHDFTPSWNAGGDTLTLTPQSPYQVNTAYMLIVTAGTDAAGNPLPGLPDTAVSFTTTPTGVAGPSTLFGVPIRFELAANCPNPMRSNTTVKFGLPKESRVRVEVYNIAGQRVKTLADGKLGAGYHQVTWKGQSDNGQKVAAGVYLVRMVTPEFNGIRKMTVVR
jgi:uncharacterized delta-60 repeat protein